MFSVADATATLVWSKIKDGVTYEADVNDWCKAASSVECETIKLSM